MGCVILRILAIISNAADSSLCPLRPPIIILIILPPHILQPVSPGRELWLTKRNICHGTYTKYRDHQEIYFAVFVAGFGLSRDRSAVYLAVFVDGFSGFEIAGTTSVEFTPLRGLEGGDNPRSRRARKGTRRAKVWRPLLERWVIGSCSYFGQVCEQGSSQWFSQKKNVLCSWILRKKFLHLSTYDSHKSYARWRS